MIAGGMGGRAFAFFEQFGIEAVTGASGKIQSVVEQYLSGELQGKKPCSQHEHE